MMADHRRSQLHSINQVLIPIMTAALIAVGGYLGNRLWNVNETVNTVATIQKEVRTNQAEMKDNIEKITITVESNANKLDDHLMTQGIISQSSSKLHHRRDLTGCTGCHATR